LVFVEAILGVDGKAISRLEVVELREIFLLSINDLLVEGGFKVIGVCKRKLDWVRGEGSKEVRGHVREWLSGRTIKWSFEGFLVS
jgi:hypothetical protein